MAAAIASVATGSAPGGNVSVGVPTGAASGDWLVAIYFADNDGAFASMTAPTGFTEQFSSSSVATSAGFMKVFTKTATGSESTYTFPGSSSSTNMVEVMRVTGSKLSFAANPVWSYHAAASVTALVAPAATLTQSGILVCSYALEGVSAGTTITPASGMTGTVFKDSAPFVGALNAYLVGQPAGTSVTKTATSSDPGSTSGTGYLTMTMAFRDADLTASVTGTATAGKTITAGLTGTVTGTATAAATITASATSTSVSGLATAHGVVTAIATAPTMVSGTATAHATVTATAVSVVTPYVVGTVSAMADIQTVVVNPFYFTPPEWRMHYFEGNRLWRRCYIDVGHSILKFGTSYQQIDNPSTDQMETATKLYIGGRTYIIDATEATALRAAGYAHWVTDSSGVQPPDIDYSQYGLGPYGSGPYGD